MSDYLFVKSKEEFKKETLLKTAKNLDNKFINKKNQFISFKSKNFNYYFVLNGAKTNEIYSFKKGIILLFVGNIFNFNKLKNNKKSIVNQILDGYLKYGMSFIKKLDGNFTILILDINNKSFFL